MAHSSGIAVSSALAEAFASGRDGGSRFLKVEIIEESLQLTHNGQTVGTADDDFSLLAPHLKDKCACYILYRLDSTNEYGYQWVLMSFVPDTAPVKDKMLYASTRSNLKLQIGDMYFHRELHGTVAADFTLAGYKAYVAHEATAAPLTAAEQLAAREEGAVDMGASRAGGVHTLAFPLTKSARDAVIAFGNGQNNYVQLTIDMSAECVEVTSASTTTVDDLGALIPLDAPAYHLFKYSHEHEGEHLNSVVFIYTCPESSKVKQKMLYSSVKTAVSDQIALEGVIIDKKMETMDPSDIDINYELHPPVVEAKVSFARPKGPGGRRLNRGGK